MIRNRAITTLIKAFAYLVVALSIALFPPPAAHAGLNMNASRDAQQAQAGDPASHHAVSNAAAKSAGVAKCASDVKTDHADTGANQCCSGICLTVVLTDGPVLRQGQIASSRLTARSTQMLHVEPDGFCAPPNC